jgi:putative transposase
LEHVYLHAFETGSEARRGIGSWIGSYNRERPHSSIDGLTPNEAYGTDYEDEKLAA